MSEPELTPLPTAIPKPRQLEFQSWEMGLFLHFGIRTFYEGHRDWDGKPMSSEKFNPTQFDCGQWMRTAKDAGLKYAVLTAKHHDGFANWPTKFSKFSVASSPWKNGKGDVIREFTDACREYGIKPGLYYSPADSDNKDFKDAKKYDDFFINQISEILTGYGEIDLLWFDGCGSENHQYDWPRITREIRKMQPRILIFNMGDPDYRWVGNESGIAPQPCWNTVDAVPFSVQTDSKDKTVRPAWLPAECDFRMRKQNWFFSDQDEDTVKTLDELLGIYYYSVGRGANFLINIGPDRRGHLPDKDTARLLEFGAEITRRFSNPIARLSDCKREGNTWVYENRALFVADHVVLQENIAEGEHIRRFVVEVYPEHCKWPVKVFEGQSVGHKAIVPFPAVKAHKVAVRVLETDGTCELSALDIYYAGAR